MAEHRVTAPAGSAVDNSRFRETLQARVSASPAWLADRRGLAWAAYQELPLPSSARDEDWRRTPINRLRLDRFDPAVTPADADVERARARRDAGAPDSAFLAIGAGGVLGGDGADALLAQGVIIAPLSEAAERHAELVERGLSIISAGESTFTALWNAIWEDGLFVYVPRNVAATAPVWLSHVAAEGGLTLPACVIVLDDGAQLRLIEDMTSISGEHAAIAVTTAHLGSDAQLEHVSVQDWSRNAWHLGTVRAEQGRGSRLRLVGLSLGSRLQKTYWQTRLQGDGSEADITGVAAVSGERHLDHQSLQAHVGRDTRSALLLKTAVRDTGRSVYSGMIDVEPSAVHTDGYVQNRNLLLSRGARASGIPRLEIRANDVRCGHGATVGHIDDDERFYLQSRGIATEEADRIIVRGFFADALDRLPDPGLREWADGLIAAEVG